MMQDYVRTSTYQRAIHINSKDFQDKVKRDFGFSEKKLLSELMNGKSDYFPI